MRRVSLGFRPRPSLSVLDYPRYRRVERRVAGVQAPAFVERVIVGAQDHSCSQASVAGVQAPAFVER